MKEHNTTVIDLLEQTLECHPSNAAIAWHDGIIDYSGLIERSRRVAAAISARCADEIIALYFPMTPEFIVAFLGGLFAKKCVLPLNLLLSPEDLKLTLTDANAGCVIAPAAIVPKLKPLGLPVHSYTDLLQEPPLSTDAPRPKSSDLCTLIYTSGTTGKPKGVMLTHSNISSNALSAVHAMRVEPKNRFLACLPTFHSLAITGTMIAPLVAGASIATLPRFDPEAALTIASAMKCDVLMMVPSMYRLFARMQGRRPQDMSHLKLAVAGAEPLSAEIREQFKAIFGIDLLEGYGQTETSPVISINLPWANKPGTVGQPIQEVSVRIVDGDTQIDVPKGQPAEIWVSGPNVMKGYRNRPEETAKVLMPDGWLRTGDIGRLTADGYIQITGRLREMVKVGGEMVFPDEVERVLLTHSAVAEAGAAGVKDERKGEILKAFVVLKSGAQATAEELMQHCRSKLPGYKVPHQIDFRPELPKGPSGKILRRELK